MLKWARLGYALPFLVLAIGLLITYQLWKQAQQDAARVLQTEFDFRVRETGNRVEQRMATYKQVLRGVAGLFAASVNVERNEFHDYIAKLRLEENYPGIQGIGFAQVVPLAQKSQHIAAMHKQGFLKYTIHPEGKRDSYTSVIYIEPFDERNRRAFGYDMFSDMEQPMPGDTAPGLRHTAMEQARDLGKATISGKIKLMMELGTDKNPQAGTLLYLPVYKHGMPHVTLAEHRANILGWAYAPFRMNNLMAGILGEHAAEFDIEIFDGDGLSDKTLLYDDDSFRRAGSKSSDARFHAIRRLEIDGRPWTMAIYSLQDFEARLDREKPQIVLNAATGVSLLLALLTGLLVHVLKTSREVAENTARLQEMFENMSSGVAVYHASPGGQDFIIASLNRAAERIEKIRREDVAGKNVLEVFPGITAFGLLDVFRRVWKNGVAEYLPPSFYQDERISGWRESYVYKLHCGQIVAIYDDVTKRKQAEEQEHFLANHDTLTGLPNRLLLNDRISQAIAKAKRDKVCMALMFIDLDNFKPINDDLGHDVGDLALGEAAKRLQDCMRESDTAARIGGDEFVVLLPTIEAKQDAMAVAEKIRHALCQPFELAGHSICISSSIGIAIYPDHGCNEGMLLKNADIAMYHAKESGRNTVKLFSMTKQEGCM